MDIKYKNELLTYASKLDNSIDGENEFLGYATIIVENQDKTATITLLKRLSSMINSSNYSVRVTKISIELKDSLIRYYGYIRLQEICNMQMADSDDKRTLTQLLAELNELVGLRRVKEKVNDLIVYQKVQLMRKNKGLSSVKNTLHLAFTGNPGTGKTTVARIVGRIYKQIGLLSKGHFIEVSRTDLIAGYQGQTALKVKAVIERAKGGVLFIDEAYSITENDHSDSYGKECLTELTKALEDYRDDLVVIVAGYTEPMDKFFKSNPGLKSRFNTFVEFDDYDVNELESILMKMCESNDYTLSNEVKEKIKLWLNEKIMQKNINFANGRLVRNIYDDLVMNHAKRVVDIDTPTLNQLSIIIESDFII